jgi:hypothetical protein
MFWRKVTKAGETAAWGKELQTGTLRAHHTVLYAPSTTVNVFGRSITLLDRFLVSQAVTTSCRLQRICRNVVTLEHCIAIYFRVSHFVKYLHTEKRFSQK